MVKKTGFQYYKVETDRYDDVRIRKLKMSFGAKGISVYDYLLAQIYRYKGCFIVCDESCVFNVAEYFGVKEQLVKEIVSYCGEVGLFDKELLTGGNVITSATIQMKFVEMCKSARRNYVEIPKSMLLISDYVEKENLLLYEDWLEQNSGKTDEIPVRTEEIPVKNAEIPENQEDSRKNEKITVRTEEIPEKTEEIPESSRGNDEIPVRTEKIPGKTDEIPVITEEIPEKTAKTHENTQGENENFDDESLRSTVTCTNNNIYSSYYKEEKRLTIVSGKETKGESESGVVSDFPVASSELSLTPTISAKEKTAQKMERQQALLKEREQAFIESLSQYLPMYGRDMLNDFYSYWTEPNKSRTKMRFELERTWDFGRRLITWSNRSKNTNVRNNGRKEQQSAYDSMQDAVRAGFGLSDAERQSEDEIK